MAAKIRPKVLCLEGAIGIGKSTLVEILSKKLKFNKIVPVFEPVDKWKKSGMISEFYADIKGKAMEFQHYAFITRLQALEKAFADEPNGDLYILERTPFSDRHIFMEMLHEGKFVDKVQLERYVECWQSWQKLWPATVLPTHFIFLNCDLDESMRRIEKRDREGEKVDVDYQRRLMVKCQQFSKTLVPSYPILQLNCDSDYTSAGVEQDHIVNLVQQFLDTN